MYIYIYIYIYKNDFGGKNGSHQIDDDYALHDKVDGQILAL